MAIPYWREVRYTDDGCSIYECLNCYNSWESRSPPWNEYKGIRSARGGIWRLCPICGCHWLGQKSSEKEKYYPCSNNDRLQVCNFKIIEVYRDTSCDSVYETRSTRYSGLSDANQAIYYLKQLREEEKESKVKFDNVTITYHVEKDN